MCFVFNKIADRLINGLVFNCPGNSTFFRIVEVEIYPEDDPYTHGHPDQLKVGPDRFYFHRSSASPNAKYKGGTYKGVDVTFVTLGGTRGGALIRSIETNNGCYVEGPCKVVEFILERWNCETISEFVEKHGTSISKWTNFGKNRNTNELMIGPRFGLGFAPENRAKYKSVYSPLRYCTRKFLEKALQKGKASMVVSPFNRNINNGQKLFDMSIPERWVIALAKDWVDTTKPKKVDDMLSAYGTWIRNYLGNDLDASTMRSLIYVLSDGSTKFTSKITFDLE